MNAQYQTDIDRWLSPPNPWTNYNKALQQCQEGTGLWFLQSDTFATWKAKKTSFLWLYGIPGCGKTILSSTIVEHLKNLPNRPLLFFYFDFNDTEKGSLGGVVRSLIDQLYRMCKNAQEPLDAFLLTCSKENMQPSCESLCKVLLQMIERTKEVWIVLDALDECFERKGLLSWIRDLGHSEHPNVHFLLTSRPEQDIQSGLSGLVNEESKISIQSDLIGSDISAYIRAEVREGEGLKRWQSRPDIQEEIEERLIQKANGM